MGSFPATYNDPNYLAWILKQLVASSVQLYAGLGGCYSSRPIDNTLH